MDKEAIKFAVSADIGGGSITMRPNDSDKVEERLELRATENVSMAFALRYLNLFNKASTLSDELGIFMTSENPVVMRFSFDLGEIKYFLAPKISEDA